MGGPGQRPALAVVVTFVCVVVLGAAAPRPVAASPASFSPPGNAQPQHSHYAVVARSQTTRPPRGLSARSAATGPAWPSGTWVPVGPSPITGSVQDPSQVGGAYGLTSGRITALVTDPTNPATVFAGAADGGVWKSINGGASWTALTDAQPTLAIGSLAIDSTGQIIYAGTGEANGSQDSEYGDGVLKSTDGGSTWALDGSSTFAGLHIGSIVIDSQVSNAQRVLAATDAGLYVSADGGSTWTRNTNIDSVIVHLSTFDHSIFEIHQDPAVPARFFATVGDFCATEQGQVLVSGDSGSTWSNSDSLTIPTDCALRVSLGAGPSNTEYAAWSDINGDLKYIRKSTNGGASWSTVSGTPLNPDYMNTGGTPQAWYDNVVAVDPTNANHAVFGGVTVMNTTNGGNLFTDVGHVYDSGAGLHPDFHAIAFTGADTLYIGNDGGVWHSTTLGGTTGPSWTDVNSNLEITQFYGGSALNVSTLIGGAQDNGDPGRLPTTPPAPLWQQYGEGDGTGTAIKPGSNGNSFYMSVPQAGILSQTSALSGGIEANPTIAAPCNFGPNPPQGTACNDPAAFVAPFVMDPANGNKLFAATNHVYRSTTGGLPAGNGGWSQISPDLTSGTANFTGNSDFITAMAMIPGTNTVVTGAGVSGTVFETLNGSLWTNISGNLPNPTSSSFAFVGSTGWITSVAINPANAAEVWVTIGESVGTGTVWHTTTAGTSNTWTDLSSGGTAPITGPVNSIVEDPTTATTLYVGTASGVYTCTGCGGGGTLTPSWSTAGSGMPAVSVSSVTISSDNTTLVAWTHGRGAWELPLTGGGTPVANLQPASLSFGQVTFGTESPTQTVTLSDWGDATLSPTASLTGANAGDFFIQSDTCTGASMSANTACTVAVGSAPTHVGSLSAALQFADSAPGSPQSVALTATGDPQPIRATSTQQYFMNGSDGTTWQVMDPTNLSMTFTPTADETAVFTANADLWTEVAQYNQDIGIQVTPQGGSPTLIAWKESGGFAGTFSPNAAAVQGSFSVGAGTTYTARIVWKANKLMPAGDHIAAGAGHTGNFSPTTLEAQLVSTLAFQQATSTNQFLLSSSDGVAWSSQDSASRPLPSLTVTPGSNSSVLLSANADLWTFSAGFNQDIGIQVAPNGGSSTIVAWKESGGFAGTFSPNAAFVQALVPMTAGTSYNVQLVWKSNKPLTGGAQIAAGAGPITGLFSPTDLLAVVDPMTGGPQIASSTTQYFLTGSDGTVWNSVDTTNLQQTVSPGSTCEARITANADLWTVNVGLNQDIGIQVTPNGGAHTIVAWKESGGFAGTFSPNAAFVQGVYLMTGGQTYTVTLVWKSNIAMGGGQQIAMGAGPLPPHSPTFSPTTLVVDLHC